MISFLIGIITAAIVFYMSMIYGNAALALLGCFMCVFMVLTFIALLVKAHRAVAAINIPIAIATQGESIRGRAGATGAGGGADESCRRHKACAARS